VQGPGSFALVRTLYRPVVVKIKNPSIGYFNSKMEAPNAHGAPACSFPQVDRSHIMCHPSLTGVISPLAQQGYNPEGFSSPYETIGAVRGLFKEGRFIVVRFYGFTDEL